MVNLFDVYTQARKIPAAHASLSAGRWSKSELQGRSVAGKTLGIVGYGSIGQAVSSIALALGMSVVALRRSKISASSAAGKSSPKTSTLRK